MFTIDGFEWSVPCTVERLADVTSTDVSGFNILGEYINDVQGTYMSYALTVACPFGMENEYAQLYEILTEPVDGHSVIFPYNNKTISLTARVSQVQDALFRLPNGHHWKGTRFTFVSNYPTKRLSLGEVLTRGITPGPDVAAPAVGEVWEWDGTSWTEYSPPSYPDADAMYF